MAETHLIVKVTYDPDQTDPESLATALDRLMETSLSTPDILDDYGPVEVGEFFPTDPTKLVADLRHIGGQPGNSETTRVTVEVENSSAGLVICVDGYGLKEMQPGYGGVIFCEIYEGLFRTLVWPDINDADPTIIGLGDARESKRKDE